MQEHAHHPGRIFDKNVRRFRIDQAVLTVESIERLSLGAAARQEVDEPRAFLLFAQIEPLHYRCQVVEDVPRVHVVVPHEGFDAVQNFLLRVLQVFRDDSLQAQCQYVSCLFFRVVHLVANTQQEVERFLEVSTGGIRQQLGVYQRFEFVGAFTLNKTDPVQRVVITQAAATVFDIRLLEKDRAIVLLVPGRQVLLARFQVGCLFALDASFPEPLSECGKEILVSHKEPGVHHCRLGQAVIVCLLNALFDRAYGMPDFETDIPEHVEDAFNDIPGLLGKRMGRTVMEKKQVDVAAGVQSLATVATDGNQCERGRVLAVANFLQRLL